LFIKVARLSGGDGFESKVIQSLKALGDFLSKQGSAFFPAATNRRYSRTKQHRMSVI